MRVFVRGKRMQAAVFVVAIVLFGYSISASPHLVARASFMVGSAAASLSAAVPANPYNTLAQELADREAELARRERAQEGEGTPGSRSFGERLAPYSLVASLILFVLLLLNFYFDWRGRRGGKYRISLRS